MARARALIRSMHSAAATGTASTSAVGSRTVALRRFSAAVSVRAPKPRPRSSRSTSMRNMLLFATAAVASGIFLDRHIENVTAHSKLIISNMLLKNLDAHHASYEVKEPTTDLTAFGGYSHIQENVADLVRYLQDPKEFTRNGVKTPKGIILSGPPGVGKTYIAEAIAGQAGVPIITVSASEILGVYVGVAEENLRNLFALAKKSAPCVLCIDEIDSISQKRFSSPSHGSEHHANTLVNQLLTLLAEDMPGVIVVATTNNLASIDPAIIRPGRFGRTIEVGLPEKEDRLEIFKVHCKDKSIDSFVDLEQLARICVGFTGAKISALVNEAAMCAARENSRTISQKHFDKARTLIQLGSYGRAHTNIELKNQVAIHEAGHALVAHLLGEEVYQVSTLITSKSVGHTEILPNENTSITMQSYKNKICIKLAGRAAEILTNNVIEGSRDDLMNAKAIALHMITVEGMGRTIVGIGSEIEVEEILQEQMQRAMKLIQQNQETHTRIVEQLVKHDSLTRKEYLIIIDGKKISRSLFSSFFGSVSTISIPSKKSYVARKSTLSTPLSEEKIALFLDIPSDTIRSIEENDEEIKIRFRNYSKGKLNAHHLDAIGWKLKECDIITKGEEDSFGIKSLTIHKDSKKDFIEMVEKGKSLINSKKFSP